MGDEEQQQQESAPAGGGAQWSNGLCGCFGDCKLCIITYIVPCYTAGKVAEAVGESCVKFGVFAALPIANIICGAKIRGKVREQKGIDGGFGGDCVMHWLCPICAYVQEAREVAGSSIDADTAIDRQ